MPPEKEMPPGFRRPSPKHLQRPESHDAPRPSVERASEFLNLAFLAALASLLVMPPEKESRVPPPVQASGPVVPGKEPGPVPRQEQAAGAGENVELLARIDSIKRTLQGALQGAGTGRTAELRRTQDAKQRCRIAGAIATEHMDEIVTIAAYLQLQAPAIANDKLREKIATGISRMNIKPEDFAQDPTRLEKLNKARIQSTYAYSVLTTCGTLVLAVFGGKIKAGIDENIDLATPVLDHIEKGIRERDPRAIRAGEALVAMARKLLP